MGLAILGIFYRNGQVHASLGQVQAVAAHQRPPQSAFHEIFAELGFKLEAWGRPFLAGNGQFHASMGYLLQYLWVVSISGGGMGLTHVSWWRTFSTMTQSLGGTLLSMVLSILPPNSDLQGQAFAVAANQRPLNA